jgi:hypothetical protein
MYRPRLLASLALVTFACSKGSDAPPPAVTTTAPPAAAASAPSSQPSSAPAAAAEPQGAPFTGEVALGEGVTAADVKPTDVLFIMARESAGGGPGRLVAVQRHADVQLPKAFTVAPTDVMVPGMPFTGPFVVMARLDRDGDPMTRGQDDLYGTFEGPVMAGQGAVKLTLKKGTEKDFAPPGGAPVPAPGGAPASMPAGHP